jgi:hypothetical protein
VHKLFPTIYIFQQFTPFLIGPFKTVKEGFYCIWKYREFYTIINKHTEKYWEFYTVMNKHKKYKASHYTPMAAQGGEV